MREKGYWYYYQHALDRLVNEDGIEPYEAQTYAHEEAFEQYPLGPSNDGVPVDLTARKAQHARRRAYLAGETVVTTSSGKKARPAPVTRAEEYTAVQQGVMSL